jgi:hypothetical protein
MGRAQPGKPFEAPSRGLVAERARAVMGADSAITLDGQSRVAMGVTTYALPGARPPDFCDRIRRMIRVAITAEAFDAVAAMLALGTVAVEPERAQDGSVHIWLDPRVLAKLKVLRSPGESYSDVILRVAKGEGGNLMTPLTANKSPGRANVGALGDAASAASKASRPFDPRSAS